MVMGTEAETLNIKPWDISAPGFSHFTKRADTFLLYLMDRDSKYYEIAYADWYQMGVRLYGPNGNAMTWKAQRKFRDGIASTTREDGEMVVKTMMNMPKTMLKEHRTDLSALVAFFLGLEKRVR